MQKHIPKNHAHASSLNASWKEGIAAMIMLTIVDYYLIPLALFLGASAYQIGFLVAIPHFLGSVLQLFAVDIVRFSGSRLRFLIWGSCLQAVGLIPIALLPLAPKFYSFLTLVSLVALYRILGNLIGTAWGSLVSDYLRPDERGKYLGWRSQITGIVGVLSAIVGGLFLFFMKNTSQSVAFSILFLTTLMARLISTLYMSKMEDLPVRRIAGDDFGFLKFISRLKESNFVRFVLFVSSITFATNLASPFFSVYMLRDLKFSYLGYMAVHLSSVIAGLVAFPIWGRHADLVGNRKVLKITGFLIPVIPLLWLTSKNAFILVGVELFAGFVWGGFNLCSVNFIYDAVTPEKRVRCLSYFNLINGIGVFAGASLGGFLAEHLPSIIGSHFSMLFIISALVRFSSYFFLSPGFREVRATVQKISSSDLFFSVIGIRPLVGSTQE